MERHHFRTVIALLWLLAAPSLAMAQTDSMNYVRSVYIINNSGDTITTVQYYDGLGRPTLNATNSMGKNGYYVYTLQQYDYGDRISEQSIRAYGGTTPVYTTDLNWMYSDTHHSTTYTYDALDRVTIEKGPGDLWHNNNRFKRAAYLLNQASEVKLYSVSGNTVSHSSQNPYYGQGKLTVEQFTDENNHVSKVYKDMQGRTVMERRIDGSVNYDTYYVYDYLGNLRYVLPPKACDSMTNGSWTISSTAVKQYGYYYEYDTRGRCTKKQLPGCDYMTMTYDTDDRLITSQDGNQRNAQTPTTTYYEYDALGRQTVMGIKYPSGSKIPLLETFYDDYTFLTTAESSKVGFDSNNGYESTYASAKGLQTGSRVHHLGNPSTSEVTTMYYNAYGEMIQQRSTNHLSGNDDYFIQYNHFTGKELYRKHIHSATGQTTHTEVYTYEYDTADQLHYIKHKLDNNSQVTLSTLTYDYIGRVASKGASVSTQTYSYNIRDWVKEIEHSLFKEYISYNETSDDHVTPTNKSYNGNIDAIAWRAGSDTADRVYQFNYNALDWLTTATYSGTGSYSTSYSYDKMGNLQTLTRYGKQDGGTYGLIDNMTYYYTGNQPYQINDTATDPTYSGAFNFNDPINQSGEYTYDKNGNMTKDLNKNISSIGYNLLNLPTNISYSSGKSAAYVYDATGRKLRTSYKASASATAVPTDYCGNMIYENNVLKQILIDGGYITLSGTAPYYHYYLKDHLGNNRVVVSPAGTAEQINHYYPFGGLFGESTGNTVQRFRFNGKEFDRTHGIDWYDYGARHMTPDAGRFTTIDPMAEKYYNISPYVYCLNNPMIFIDVKGFFPKGVLILHKTSFYRADYYTFTKPAAHLISLVTGVKEDYIRNVNVMEKGIGRNYPMYNPNKGGGGITIGSCPDNVTMTFTNNYFDDNATDYGGNGFGQNVVEWLSIASHEATHIKHVEQAGGKFKYLVHFLKQYVKYKGHDAAPEEREAIVNGKIFDNFNVFINKQYGNNSLQDLFNSDLSDGQKNKQIDIWWEEWKASEGKNR